MLSGGQRQRVALARCLVLTSKLIIADEPVSMLDVSVRAEILELINNLKDRLKISVLYITHDLSTSRYIGDNIAIMHDGKILETGPIDEVLMHPRHPYTRALIGAISNLIQITYSVKKRSMNGFKLKTKFLTYVDHPE